MICPTCSQDVPDGSKFCAQCGAALEEGVPIPAPLPPPVVTIRRAPQLTAALTKFAVYIDGQRAGTIGNNETEHFKLSPGVHTFYVKIDDYKSKTLSIDLRQGQSLRLVCWPKPFGLGVTIGFE